MQLSKASAILLWVCLRIFQLWPPSPQSADTIHSGDLWSIIWETICMIYIIYTMKHILNGVSLAWIVPEQSDMDLSSGHLSCTISTWIVDHHVPLGPFFHSLLLLSGKLFVETTRVWPGSKQLGPQRNEIHKYYSVFWHHMNIIYTFAICPSLCILYIYVHAYITIVLSSTK